MKKVLTIAGSDCSGGAGIQADLKTFSAHGVYGMSVITAIVAENTCSVMDIHEVQAGLIEKQLDAVFMDIEVDAVKIGMLQSAQCMQAVARKIKEYAPKNVVIDPVMYAKNGCALMDPQAMDTLIATIIPLADMLTPNIPEAEKIAGIPIHNLEDMKAAAQRIIGLGARSVLVKGGHSTGDAIDVLLDGKDFFYFEARRINTKNTHGTGCTFSSAIAANLAQEFLVQDCVARAKAYITTAIQHSLEIGKGHGPTNHFYNLYKKAGLDY